jgi:hypothetical protein
MGAPTASIRELAAMSVLKEGFGCSDEELFEKCEYDLLTRRALGIMSLSEKVPSLDTYYCFRRRIVDYEERHGVNLMDTCFKDVTGKAGQDFQDPGQVHPHGQQAHRQQHCLVLPLPHHPAHPSDVGQRRHRPA